VRTTGAVYAGLLVALVAFAAGVILFLQPSGESGQRLGLFFGLVGVASTALVGALRADVAASGMNGGLDDRIRAAVAAANGDRRLHDPTVPTASTADPVPADTASSSVSTP
jgi:hypothetical protein